MIFLELGAVIVGFGAMVLASQRAVSAATELAVGSHVPPFVIGVTLLAVGTDLPEFANSIASSFSGHGDVNVGDSVGSAATQMTLVLGLLPLIAGTLEVPRRGIITSGLFTVAGLGALAVLLGDGNFARSDAMLLLSIWVIGSLVIHQRGVQNHQLTLPEERLPRLPLLRRLLSSFVLLAGAAMVALWAIVAIAERYGVPEFLIGFFLAAIGTSLPELVFDVTAIRRGAVAMAIGDLMGSSFVDATASVSIGPLLAPTPVSSDLVVRGTLSALIAIAIVTLLMARIRHHDWRTGVILLAIYGGFYLVVI